MEDFNESFSLSWLDYPWFLSSVKNQLDDLPEELVAAHERIVESSCVSPFVHVRAVAISDLSIYPRTELQDY